MTSTSHLGALTPDQAFLPSMSPIWEAQNGSKGNGNKRSHLREVPDGVVKHCGGVVFLITLKFPILPCKLCIVRAASLNAAPIFLSFFNST